jgi:glutamate N-acetyltransferase/amino-acid N-acetyltransferase
MIPSFQLIKGGVTTPAGFKAAAHRAGIKADAPDMALLVSDVDAAVAGTFTTNAFRAAPVRLSEANLGTGAGRAVIINSGCANACTGEQGLVAAQCMLAETAAALGVPENQVFVCSTGEIGTQLPMDRVRAGIGELAAGLDPDGGDAAARAIMTTDAFDKQRAVRLAVDGREVTIGGMAKGAGMIHPNMATMIAVLTTDAAVNPAALQTCFSDAVERSFNRVTVDGDTSTNDTALIFAGGQAGNQPLSEAHADWEAFTHALHAVMLELALDMVRDGEGASRIVTIDVEGAASELDAARAAKAIGTSLLVKTAWAGALPIWGRVLAAIGTSGAAFDDEAVDLWYDDIQLVAGGVGVPGLDREAVRGVVLQDAFNLRVELNAGAAAYRMYASDCTEAYVKFNSEYLS